MPVIYNPSFTIMKPTKETIQRLNESAQILENLSERLSKQTVMEVARVLSLYLVHYRRLYGDMPHDAALTADGSKLADDENEMLLMTSEAFEYLFDLDFGHLGGRRDLVQQVLEALGGN